MFERTLLVLTATALLSACTADATPAGSSPSSSPAPTGGTVANFSLGKTA